MPGSGAGAYSAGGSVGARPTFSIVRVLTVCLIAGVAAVAFVGYRKSLVNSELKESQDNTVSSFGLVTAVPRHLASGYTDSSGRMLADTPADASKLISPDTLVLAYGEDADLDVQPVDWPAFQKHLAEVTGKKIAVQEYNNTVADVAAVADGHVQIVALHAADTPFLVNNAGFIPVAVLGSEAGATGNHLDLAVAAKSNIKTLDDLKGHTLTNSRPTSIVGHRAPIAILIQEAGLKPDVDYFINYSFGQTRSVLGLAGGEYEAVALSDDKLQSLLKAGRIKPEDYRIIYESQIIPRFTIGYVYNLQPELAAKIVQAITDFKNEGGPNDEATGKPMRFVSIDYKKDFEFVRKIDELFDARLGYKQQKPTSAPADAAEPTEAKKPTQTPADGATSTETPKPDNSTELQGDKSAPE